MKIGIVDPEAPATLAWLTDYIASHLGRRLTRESEQDRASRLLEQTKRMRHLGSMTDREFAMLRAIADGRRTFAPEYRDVARELAGRGLIVTRDFPPNMRGVGARDQGFLAELTDKGRADLTSEVDRRRPPV